MAGGTELRWFRVDPNQMGMGQNPGTPGEPQNSWDLWMFIPLKMVLIGIDPYPNIIKSLSSTNPLVVYPW